MQIKRNIKLVLSINWLKTLYINIKYVYFRKIKEGDYKALRNMLILSKCLPIIVFWGGVLRVSNTGQLILGDELITGMLKIGIKSIPFAGYNTRLDISGKLTICGKCSIGRGSYIYVGKDASLFFGGDFCSSGNDRIICKRSIEFGKGCMLSWDILIMDSDLHNIYNDEGIVMNADKSIIVGDKVWICSKATILKGAYIPSNSIVASCSVYKGKQVTNNSIYATNYKTILLSDFNSWG